jgi:hypothetical protein
MAGEGERGEARLVHDDPQFLLELAYQSVLRPLAGLDLAAGEFPQARHRAPRRALCDQYARVRIHKGARGDEDEFHGHELQTFAR